MLCFFFNVTATTEIYTLSLHDALPTGIDYPGESQGLLPGYWSGSTIGNVPIGQGIGVTPIQMAAAYAAIANGGVLREPYLVQRVGDTMHRADRGRRVL